MLTSMIKALIVCAFVTVIELGLFRARPTIGIIAVNQTVAVLVNSSTTVFSSTLWVRLFAITIRI